MSEHQLSPSTIWKFQIVRCAMINRLLIEPAPEKRLYSGNCGFTVPTIRDDTFCGSVNRALTKGLNMMFLSFEKIHIMRSNWQNRSRYVLFRVLTSSYHHVNMPGFPETFNKVWQCGKGVDRLFLA